MRPPRSMLARYAGTCAVCDESIEVGAPIWHIRRGVVSHQLCGAAVDTSHLPTTRERLEARAERRDEWAESRAGRAARDFEQADRLASVIPMGQPILVGHYSEGRDRRYRAQIHGTMDRAVEGQRAAEYHARAADGIRSQLDRAIYDDDPDAIERLAAKLAKLEAQREAIKERNRAARKVGCHCPDDCACHSQWRETICGCVNHTAPAYLLANLGGNITRTRQRLARLTAAAERSSAAE